MFKFSLFLTLCFLSIIKLIAQTNHITSSIIKVDELIGYENTGLYNGTKYVELYRTVNERHKFFLSSEFLKGDLVYNNQYYGNVNLKYDLDADNLLLDIGYKWKFPILKLYKNRISEFHLGGKKFINIRNDTSTIAKGFYEVLWSSTDLILLKKHKKKKFKRIFNTVVYFEFDDDNSYFFKYQDQYYPIQKKAHLTNVFPRFKEDLNRLYNKKLVKLNPEPNLVLIFGELHKYLENERL